MGKCRRPQSRNYLFFLWKIFFFGVGGAVVVAPFKPEFSLKAVKRKTMNFMEVFWNTVSVIPAIYVSVLTNSDPRKQEIQIKNSLALQFLKLWQYRFLVSKSSQETRCATECYLHVFSKFYSLWADYFDERLLTANRPKHFLLLIYIRVPVVSHFSSVNL